MEVNFVYKNCSHGTWTCTSSGQAAGTIVSSKLTGAPVYLDAERTQFGLLLTPPESGVMAEFTCAGLVKVVWSGNGLIGQITSPALNVKSRNFTLRFFTNGTGNQEYQQVEEAGTKYHLYQATQGGNPEAMGVEDTDPAELAGGAEGTFEEIVAAPLHVSASPSESLEKPFSISGGVHTTVVETGQGVKCTTSTGEGHWTSETALSSSITFHGCHYRTNETISCTTPGQATGDIVLPALTGTPVFLTPAKNKFGLLLTPPKSGVFAEFKCSILTGVWSGNGLIGRITNPALNVKSPEFTLSFTEKSGEEVPVGQQTYQQVEEAGTKYHLKQQIGGSSFETALVGTDTALLPKGVEDTFIP